MVGDHSADGVAELCASTSMLEDFEPQIR